MYFDFVYRTGRKIKIFPKIASLEKKFKQVAFPYSSSEFLSGIFVWFFSLFLIGTFFSFLANVYTSPFFLFSSYLFYFASVLLCFSAYLYGANIYYTQGILRQKEEMLQALLEISNYISLNTSIEYAFAETSKGLGGVLGTQFRQILEKLEKKQYRTLGEAFEEYIPIWIEINPDFVKGLNMLQTAALAPKHERDLMLREAVNAIIQSYYSLGKRSTETLSNQAKTLISIGVMLPMMSLIMLPLISIFLPQLINVPLLIFIYDVFCPALLLLFSMNFALHRVQVNTIDLSLSPKFKPMPKSFLVVCIILALVFAIPGILHFMSIDLSTSEGVAREYKFESLFNIWFIFIFIPN